MLFFQQCDNAVQGALLYKDGESKLSLSVTADQVLALRHRAEKKEAAVGSPASAGKPEIAYDDAILF